MKKSEIVSLINSLSTLNNLTGAKFSYAIARNLNLLKPEGVKFEEARKSLIESYAKKDKDGNLEIKEGQYIIKKQDEFQVEFAKLLEEEVEIKLFQIESNEIPSNISVQQMQGILPIIKE